MSRIDQMLREMCPDGVEHLPLGDIAGYSKVRIPSESLDAASFVGVDNLLANCRGRVDAQYQPNTGALCEFKPGDVLIGNIRPYLKKAWLSDRLGGASGDVLVVRLNDAFVDRVLSPFLYYLLSSEKFFRYDQMHARGGKMPRGSKEKILQFVVPVPPLDIQREIVKVLDTFAELEAELEARRNQYAHYRDLLLSFDDARKGGRTSLLNLPSFEVRWIPLGDAGQFIGGLTGKSKEDFGLSGARFVSYKNVFENRIARLDWDDFVTVGSDERQNRLRRGDVLLTGSSENREEAGMSAVIAHDPDESLYLNSFCMCYRWNDEVQVDPAFASHLFRSRLVRQAIARTAMGVTRFNLSKAELRRVKVPIPPLEVQRRIADVLDDFDALVNDLSSGLPAEIEARRKQYEHYRDRLLTFPSSRAETPHELRQAH